MIPQSIAGRVAHSAGIQDRWLVTLDVLSVPFSMMTFGRPVRNYITEINPHDLHSFQLFVASVFSLSGYLETRVRVQFIK
jgi:hypothetical protein